MKGRTFASFWLLLLVALAFVLSGCAQATQPNPWPDDQVAQAAASEDVSGDAQTASSVTGEAMPASEKAANDDHGNDEAAQDDHGSGEAAQDDHEQGQAGDVDYVPDVSFTLETSLGPKGLGFLGKGGDIDGQLNPTLVVPKGAVVQITLVNGDGIEHDVAFPDFDAHSDHIGQKGASSTFVFRADKVGEFPYYCTVPGHREAGMEGVLRVVEEVAEAGEDAQAADQGADIVRDPTDVPPPVGDREPTVVRVELEAKELVGQLADGVTFTYWTFDSKVPGPMIRIREGDTVEIRLKNAPDNKMTHSIDLHAVNGPGGGAVLTQTPPGEERVFTFKGLQPGLYVYHCATPLVAQHIANGMYGMILVEPEGGLPPVDREFYVMQGEIYTQGKTGEKGYQEFSFEKLMAEEPEYVVFNGMAAGLASDEYALRVNTGERVRIYFGVGGPNLTSSFHIIGEIFDRVYDQAALTSPPLTNVQTTLVPPGGATVVEFTVEVPGRYILVDHALTRLEKGLVGFLYAEGPDVPEVYKEGPVEE